MKPKTQDIMAAAIGEATYSSRVATRMAEREAQDRADREADREWETNNRIADNWARQPGQERFGDDR